MLTFIIPLLLGTILGFLIRRKPSDAFAITTGKRLAWGIGIALGGVAIGTPIGLSISSATGPQIAGLIGAGLGLGVFNILSVENATYKKWSDKNALAWLIGGVFAIFVIWFVVAKQRTDFSEEADNASANPALSTATSVEELARSLGGSVIELTVPNTYLGVSLGDSEQQVRYVLGEPTRVDEKGDLKLLVYGDDENERGSSFGILTSTNRGGVIQLACHGGDSCPPLLGLEIGDSEERVKSILGSEIKEKLDPNDAPISTSAVMKKISFGENSIATFYLSQRKIVLMVLSKNSEQPR